MNLKYSTFDRIKNILSILVQAGMVFYLGLAWSELPNKIPAHYNFAGEIDRWGSKSELLILPLVTFLLWLGLSVVERFPKIWNTGVTVTERNRNAVYAELLALITSVKLLMVLILSYLEFHSFATTKLPFGFTSLTLGTTLGMMIFHLRRLFKAGRSGKD